MRDPSLVSSPQPWHRNRILKEKENLKKKEREKEKKKMNLTEKFK